MKLLDSQTQDTLEVELFIPLTVDVDCIEPSELQAYKWILENWEQLEITWLRFEDGQCMFAWDMDIHSDDERALFFNSKYHLATVDIWELGYRWLYSLNEQGIANIWGKAIPTLLKQVEYHLNQ